MSPAAMHWSPQKCGRNRRGNDPRSFVRCLVAGPPVTAVSLAIASGYHTRPRRPRSPARSAAPLRPRRSRLAGRDRGRPRGRRAGCRRPLLPRLLGSRVPKRRGL